MPDNKSISQLTTAEQITQSDLFETSIPNGSLGYLSRKVSLDVMANYIANQHQYSALQTDHKKLIEAINEAASGGGGASIEEMTMAEYNALTPEQKADGTLRAISDATTSISDIDDVNISSPADGNVLAYDSTSNKWANKDIDAADIPFDNTASGMTATDVQAAIDEVVDDGYYHAGDSMSLLRTGMVAYGGSTLFYFTIPLDKPIGDDVTDFSLTGSWRSILTDNSTLVQSVFLNNVALSSIGTVAYSKVSNGVRVVVTLPSSSAFANWSLGTIMGTSGNILTFS